MPLIPISIALLFLLIRLILFYINNYNSNEHTYYKANSLRRGAKISRIQRKVVGIWNNQRIRTIVYFDDGFRFVSHNCEVKDRVLFVNVSLSDEINKGIVQGAMIEHDAAVAARDTERNR